MGDRKKRSSLCCIVLSAILIILLSGCSTDSSKDNSSQMAETAAPQSPKVSEPSQVPAGRAPSIDLQPQVPIGAAETRAYVTNMPSSHELIWERNGQIIEGARGDRLPKGLVKRDDMITVRALYDGGEVQTSARVGNSPPEIVAINFVNPAIHHGVDIVLDVVASDADGDALSLTYRWMRNGEEIPGQVSGRLPGDLFRKGDRIAVHVVPADVLNEGVPFIGREFAIPGAPPNFVSEPPLRFQSLNYQYQVRAVDPDGDPVSYSLIDPPQGMNIDSKSGLLAWSLANVAEGDYRIRIRAVDSDGMEAFQEFTLTLAPPDPVASPER